MRTHDVAIVGAGPAGSTAAYFLARSGIDVALIDRATFPRDKTCGDGVTPRALGVLDDMGVLVNLTTRAFRINHLDFYAPNGRVCVADVPRMDGLPDYTLVVPRFVLDEEIRKRALAAGACPYQMEVTETIRNGASIVGVRGNGVSVSARLTVIATGATTRLLRQAGFLHRKPGLVVAARQYVENLPPLADGLEFYFDRVQLPGYGWLFPTSPTSANVGVGYLGSRTESPRLLFEALRRDHPRVRSLLKEATPVGPVKGYPLRVDFPQATVMVEGAIGVGEAIGLVNPFTGEGIDYSLESGRIAAESILGARDLTMGGLREYPRRLNERFRDYFVVISRLKDLLYNTFMLNRIIGRGATSSYIRDTMMHICFGLTSPRQVFSPKLLWEVLRP